MSDPKFSSAELRLMLAAIALVPSVYFFWPAKKQDSTEHVKTFNKLIKGYSTLRPEALVATATRDFAHTILPASLHIPARQVAAFRDHAETVLSIFESFEMTPQPNREGESVHLCLETSTVIAHCKMGGKVSPESELGQKLITSGLTEWWTESVLFVQMSPNGKRVIEVREFVHSVKAEELQRRLSGVLSN
jgi:hypothetical protein